MGRPTSPRSELLWPSRFRSRAMQRAANDADMAAELTKLGRYAVVGGFAVAVHASVSFALLIGFGVAPFLSHMFGFFAGFGVSSIGHARFTFRHSGPLGPALTRFFCVALTALTLSELALLGLLEGLSWPGVPAQAAAIVLSVAVSYTLARIWAFR